jgi:hypothetical protein
MVQERLLSLQQDRDSPLVTYKRRDVQPGEAIPEDVGRAFYEALALTPPDSQIIILENEDPPEEVPV